MAINLPHGVLFRGGAEERIRQKLLKDGHIDTVIGLPANLFYSTGIPVLKKCKKPDDVLFINAAELNLAFHPVLEKTADRPAQKDMANSSQQARNVDGALAVRGQMPTGPVMLDASALRRIGTSCQVEQRESTGPRCTVP